jgi:hypothetical protein
MRRSYVVGILLTCAALSAGAAMRAQVVSIGGDFPIPTAGPRELPKGTGLILGRVVEADSRQPIDRAFVFLRSPLGVVDPVMTDSQGRFVFRDLPKGEYQVRTMRNGYVEGAYGKRSVDDEAGRDTQPLTLDDNEHVGDLTIAMWKYAAIEGTVTDENGEPLVAVTVRALPRRLIAGRALFELGFAGQTTQTDDRGMFRLGSLRPGDYIVAVPTMAGAMPRDRAPAAGPNTPLNESSSGAGRWLTGSGTARGPGIDVGDAQFLLTPSSFMNVPGFAGLTRDGQILAYSTTFYSGATAIGRASVITLRSGDAREGIHVQLTPAPTSRISGTLVGPSSGGGSIMLRLVNQDASSTTMDAEIAQTVSGPDGRFTFFGVTPGDYRIQVLRLPAARSPAARSSTVVQSAGGPSGLTIMAGVVRLPPDEPTDWADTPVSVTGSDVTGVTVELRAGLRVRGRVQFEGTSPPPAFERVAIHVDRADGREHPNLSVSRTGADPTGAFLSYGQTPGSYLIRVPDLSTGWRLKSAMLGGRDVSLTPFDLSTGDVDGVTLVLTDQPAAELAGTVTTSRGQPPQSASVIVFPADRQSWSNVGRSPRHLRAVAVGRSGRYVVSGLPAGSYLVAATLDSRPAWADPKFLETLARTAQAITAADGEKRTVDLRLPGGPASDEAEAALSHGPWSAEDDGQQTPVRDVTPAAASGTGEISGVVTTAGDRPQPVRRANVTLTGATLGVGRLVVTDQTGGFRFAQVPPGRYTLTVAKPAYLSMTYGATRPGRPGTPIQLADGQKMTNVSLTLQRGASISGVVRDERGQPAPAVNVQALWYRTVNGERRLQTAGLGLGRELTDDRGAYRLFGLGPGEYTVAVSLQASPGVFRLTSDADVQVALQRLKPGSGRGAAPPAGAAPATRSPSLSYTPSFYPGTPDVSAATFFTLAPGEERSGVDLTIGLLPAAVLRGTVTNPAGPLPANLELRLINPTRPLATLVGLDFASVFPVRPGPDGAFQFRGVMPGRYVVVATTGSTGRGAPSNPLWGTAEVDVSGADVSGIALSLQPGMSVTGTVSYLPTTRTPPDLAGTRVLLAPQLTGSQISVGQLQVTAGADGAFRVTGVMPGRYAVRVLPPTGSTGWLVGASMLKATDLADHLLDVRPGENVSGIAVTMIDRPAELTGVLQDTTGRPAPDYTVILFGSDRSQWRSGSRRIFQVRPGTDGKFQFRNLVAGEYQLAAVTDVETGEWYDPAFLTELAKASVKVTIATGESKVQDIRIAK